MVSLSVIIPAYNRVENLKLALAALEGQVDPPDFDVVVADDGSTDGTGDFCKAYAINYPFQLRYLWCGPNMGFRPHRTRNLGIAQAQHKYSVHIDSDVLLNPHALRHYALAREQHPDIVIIGMYHFAMAEQLTPQQVRDDFDGNVMALVPQEISGGPPIPGIDCRVEGFREGLEASNVITEYDGLGFFGGNQSWPVSLFWELGGYDELMPSGDGEDAELGQRLRLRKVPVLQYEPVWGVHFHHERDQAFRQKTVQRSIAYIDKKHGIGTYAEITDPETDPREKDLSLWYTKDVGADLVRKSGEGTVYAIAGMHKGYVGIPSPEWLNLLGFGPDDIIVFPEDSEPFEDLEYHGVIRKD